MTRHEIQAKLDLYGDALQGIGDCIMQGKHVPSRHVALIKDYLAEVENYLKTLNKEQ